MDLEAFLRRIPGKMAMAGDGKRHVPNSKNPILGSKTHTLLVSAPKGEEEGFIMNLLSPGSRKELQRFLAKV